MYSNPIDRRNRGLILFLIDQSGSMGEPVAGDHLGRTKAAAAAAAVNRTIIEVILNKCMKGEAEPRDYFDIGTIGYRGRDTVESAFAGPLSGRWLVPIRELGLAPARLEPMVLRPGEDAQELPVWVDPVADGGTPMCHALYRAGELLAGWVRSYPHSFPPIVINISDGMANDQVNGETADYWAAQLKQLATTDGPVLFFNAALIAAGSPGATTPVLFPADSTQVGDQYGRFLFDISSPLPNSMAAEARRSRPGSPADREPRGFVFNAGVEELALLLDVGTRVSVR